MKNINRTREDINNEISKKIKQLEKIKKEIVLLNRENMLISDDKQWYEEIEEEIFNNSKASKKLLIGRIHWNDLFEDESGDEKVLVKRSKIVRIDGKWKN